MNRNEQKAEKSGEAALQAILDTAVDGVVVIDDAGVILIFNRAAGRMFGHDPIQIVGKHISRLMPAPFAAEHDGYVKSYLKTGVAKIIGIGRETVGLRMDGSTFPIDLAVSEIRLGERRQFAGVVRDLTDRKRLERQILDASEREQRRMGGELHDGICQELAGLAYLVKACHERLRSGGRIDPRDLEGIGVALQRSVAHAGALARGLQPVDKMPGGLRAALLHLAEDVAVAHEITCSLKSPENIEMQDNESATHLYRIAQECVREALRAPQARRIAIQVRQDNAGLELEVSHDARRPCGSNPFAGELVLEMIEHRARVVGGRISVKAKKGGGQRVICTIPNRKA